MKIEIQPGKYHVTALPEGHFDRFTWALTVEYTGNPHSDRKWAVRRNGWCLSRSGEWPYEPLPSERDEEWLEAHRFTLTEAKRAARRELPKLVVNGLTVQDILDKENAA